MMPPPGYGVPAPMVPVMPMGVAGVPAPYYQPGMQPQVHIQVGGVPGSYPGGYPGAPRPMPHKIVNPGCPKCHGSGWKAHKNKPCGRCVCKKCNGTGYNSKKNKPCLKIKLKH